MSNPNEHDLERARKHNNCWIDHSELCIASTYCPRCLALAASYADVRQEQHEATAAMALDRKEARIANSEELVLHDDYYRGYQDALFDWDLDITDIAAGRYE